jgi:hypothetical protein
VPEVGELVGLVAMPPAGDADGFGLAAVPLGDGDVDCFSSLAGVFAVEGAGAEGTDLVAGDFEEP